MPTLSERRSRDSTLGLYRDHIFPKLCDWAMRAPELRPLRTRALAPAQGRVLEIGFGSGHNLRHYPGTVRCVVAVDPNPGLSQIAARRIARSDIQVEHHRITAERLPFDAASFDCVVSTFTLCSIPNAAAALSEIRRILRPGGELLFLEHGHCPDPAVSKWQARLTPAWRVIADGCHLDRDIAVLIQNAGLEVTSLENLVIPNAPRLFGYAFLGRARRSA